MIHQPSAGLQRIEGGQPARRGVRTIRRGNPVTAGSSRRSLPEDAVRLNEPVRSIGTVGDHIEANAVRSNCSTAHVILAVPPATAVVSIAIDQLDDAVRSVAAATTWTSPSVVVVVVDPLGYRNFGTS